MDLSLVIPVYNSDELLDKLVNNIIDSLNSNTSIKTYEILLKEGSYIAVLYGICKLENNPLFNAGTGSKLQKDGKKIISIAKISSLPKIIPTDSNHLD